MPHISLLRCGIHSMLCAPSIRVLCEWVGIHKLHGSHHICVYRTNTPANPPPSSGPTIGTYA